MPTVDPAQPRAWPLPLAVALALFGPLLLPLLPRLRDHFLGIEFVDAYGTQWFYWFVERQVATGDGFGRTDLFFHPWGKDLYRDTGANVLDALAALPFRALMGPVLGYNVFLLLALGLSALALYHLVREFTEDRAAAGVAAVLGMASPFVLQEVVEGRATQAILALPALALLFTWRAGLRPGLRPPLLAGLALAACGYQYWYYALFGGLVILGHGLWRTLRPPPGAGPRLRVLARHALIAAVAIALCAPVAGTLLLQVEGGAEAIPGMLDVASWGLTDLSTTTADGTEAGLFLWQPLRGTFGFYTMFADGTARVGERVTARTWALLILVPLAAWRLRPGCRGAWLAMVAVVASLATGPIVVFGAHYVVDPLYVALAHTLGIFQRLWWPGRAFAYLVLLEAVAVAVVLAWAGRRGPATRTAAALSLAALALAGLSNRGIVPLPAWEARVPAGYACLAQGPPGGVIQLPFHWAQAHVYYQTAHGRPMFGGMRDEQDMFTPPAWRDYRDANAFVSSLVYSSSAVHTELSWEDADLESVRDLGYRFLMLQLDSWEARSRWTPELVVLGNRHRRRRLRQGLAAAFGGPVYHDARVEIYAPWGDPSPCEQDPVEPDTTPAGPPDPSLATGQSPDTAIRVIRPLIGG